MFTNMESKCAIAAYTVLTGLLNVWLPFCTADCFLIFVCNKFHSFKVF